MIDISKIKVEKGIKITSRRPRGMSEFLRNLSINDSFVIDNKYNMHAMARHAGIKVVTRTISNTQKRVWKIG